MGRDARRRNHAEGEAPLAGDVVSLDSGMGEKRRGGGNGRPDIDRRRYTSAFKNAAAAVSSLR